VRVCASYEADIPKGDCIVASILQFSLGDNGEKLIGSTVLETSADDVIQKLIALNKSFPRHFEMPY